MSGTERCGRLFVAVSIGLVVTGCGWWLRITEVSGRVTIDGRPARNVRVVFDPEGANRPRALASTDADGAYRLSRLGPGNESGAAAGKYVVKVFRDSDDPESPRIPSRYGAASELRFEVVAGKPNTFDIDITSK